MNRLALIACLFVAGCEAAMPDRMTLGGQIDADNYELKTYVVQFQWQLKPARVTRVAATQP